MPKANGLHHLAIATANIKLQVEYFSSVLGMELGHLDQWRRRMLEHARPGVVEEHVVVPVHPHRTIIRASGAKTGSGTNIASPR